MAGAYSTYLSQKRALSQGGTNYEGGISFPQSWGGAVIDLMDFMTTNAPATWVTIRRVWPDYRPKLALIITTLRSTQTNRSTCVVERVMTEKGRNHKPLGFCYTGRAVQTGIPTHLFFVLFLNLWVRLANPTAPQHVGVTRLQPGAHCGGCRPHVCCLCRRDHG